MKKVIAFASILIIGCMALNAVATDTMKDVVIYSPGSPAGAFQASHTRLSPIFINYATTTGVTGPANTGYSVQPLVGDVDGDGIDDIVITDGNTADKRMNWKAGHSTKTGDVGSFGMTSTSSMTFGPPITGGSVGIDQVIARFLADINGDGVDDAICVDWGLNWRGACSTLGVGLAKNPSFPVYAFGEWEASKSPRGDKPLVGDFDGDGKTDICVFRPDDPCYAAICRWYVAKGSSTAFGVSGTTVGQFGDRTDFITPLVGDINGDGRDDAVIAKLVVNGDGYSMKWIACYADATGKIDYFTGGGFSNDVTFGIWWTDTPFVADINGDGKADIGYTRKSPINGLKYQFVAFTYVDGGVVKLSNGTRPGDRGPVQYGLNTDTTLIGQIGAAPADGMNFFDITGDYNNDGKVNLTDLQTFAGNWLINCVTNPSDPECAY